MLQVLEYITDFCYVAVLVIQVVEVCLIGAGVTFAHGLARKGDAWFDLSSAHSGFEGSWRPPEY